MEATTPALAPDEFRARLLAIDWTRYPKHWTVITGVKLDKSGAPKQRTIKDGAGSTLTIVEGKAENTATAINGVVNKILSDTWTDLKSSTNT